MLPRPYQQAWERDAKRQGGTKVARPLRAKHMRHASNSAALAAAREGGKLPSSCAPAASQPASGAPGAVGLYCGEVGLYCGEVGLYAARAGEQVSRAWPASATARCCQGSTLAGAALACAPGWAHGVCWGRLTCTQLFWTYECTSAGAAMQEARCHGAPGLAGLCAGEVGEYAARGARAAGQRLPGGAPRLVQHTDGSPSTSQQIRNKDTACSA